MGTGMKAGTAIFSFLGMVAMAMRGFAAGRAIDPAKLIDLTYTFDTTTIYWPTEHPFVHQFEHYGMTPGGYFYSSGKFAAPEHGGTHMDAPIHFSKGGMTVDQVPISVMVGPAAVVDFSQGAANNPDAMLTVGEIQQWESVHGGLPDGAIVVARS
jgi:kynurenine formamidase